MKALLAVSLAALASSAPTANSPPRASSTVAPITSVATLKRDMRKLWTDHVVWTRDYIIAAIADQPDQQAAVTRLMRNQDDIGAAIAVYYGKTAGDKLTGLLKEHINISADVVKAAKSGDTSAQDKADKRWHANAEDIAEFLSKANPTHWPKATLEDMMYTHLSTTTAEVTARLNKDWDGDVHAFDKVYDHILTMSDAIADGIAKQFPQKVAADQ